MKRLALTGAVLTSALVLSGCGFKGVYNLPLPGGADLGAHPIEVTAQFSDALDLVPQSGVKVHNVAVGRVTKITLEPSGKVADVTLKLRGDVDLPANAVASIQQSSLLGEKYVDLAAPTGVPATGSLANGAHIVENQTSDGVQLEQVFGALSLLLNGGGVAQLRTITTELNKAANGRTGQLRQLLTTADKVVGQLDAHKSSITTALDSLSKLSATLDSNKIKIDDVLANLSPGLKVLSDERTQLVGMLTALNKLSGVTVRTVKASQADLVADLKQLQPILQQLAASGSALPQSLQVLLTYPFPDSALGAIKGDYLNTFITTNYRTLGTNPVTADDWPSSTATSGPSASGSASGTPSASITPQVISAPPNLLPATSSVSAGVSSSAIVSSPDTSGSSSPSAAGSSTPSSSGSASGSSSPSTSSGSPSDPGSPTTSATSPATTPPGTTSPGTTSSAAAPGTSGTATPGTADKPKTGGR